MTPQETEKFAELNKTELIALFNAAKESRAKHTVEDRLIALELMTCAISASLNDEDRERFLWVMNSLSLSRSPLTEGARKATADLNVLSSEFESFFMQLS